MYFIVYKITNNINSKEYIGAHKTSDLDDDDYMGSGKHLKHSQKKYGLENFSKEIIFRAVSVEAMYFIERMLVDEEYVSRDDTYNLKLGGSGGFDYINSLERSTSWKKGNGKGGKKIYELKLGIFNLSDQQIKSRAKKTVETKRKIGYKPPIKQMQTEAVNEKRKLTFENIEHQKGEKNSQYGKMWIYNLELKENKTIPKGDLIPDGWLKGRKMKF